MTPGVLGHLLLGLLSRSEQTGYELTRAFDTTLKNVWGASHSQIYPELAKLEGRGLIRKTTAGPRGSQRYAVTAEGLGEHGSVMGFGQRTAQDFDGLSGVDEIIDHQPARTITNIRW